MVGLQPLPGDSLGALWLPACLLWPSLWLRVCESSCLFPWFFPFRGPTPLLRFVPQFGALSESLSLSIPRSFLVESLSAFAVGLSVALCLCPGVPSAFLCVGLVCRSRSLCRPSHRLYQSFACGCPCGGASPHALSSVGTMGLAVAPPLSPYTGPCQSLRFCLAPLGAQVGVSYFSCVTFRMYSWR